MPAVAAAAAAAIAAICSGCGYSGLGDLVASNADYAIDGICARLRALDCSPRYAVIAFSMTVA